MSTPKTTPARASASAASSSSSARSPAPEFGDGWTAATVERRGDKRAGQADTYWFSPCGRRFRSKAEVGLFKAALDGSGGDSLDDMSSSRATRRRRREKGGDDDEGGGCEETESRTRRRRSIQFSKTLCKVHKKRRGPHSPPHPSTLGHSSGIIFPIQEAMPPRRVRYPGRKCVRGPSPPVDMSTTSIARGPPVQYYETWGRCHLGSKDSRLFRWSSGGADGDESNFLGYNKCLGRVYFSSFVLKDERVKVGEFIRWWDKGSIEYFRIIGAFQATKSFMGEYPLPTKKRRKKASTGKKEEIQKRGHPYIVVVPLERRSGVEASKSTKARKKNRSRSSAYYDTSDADTDFGFTSCSDAEGGESRLGTTRRKKAKLRGRKGAARGTQAHEPVEPVELVLAAGDSAPAHVEALPEWLGADRAMSMFKIQVEVVGSDKDDELNHWNNRVAKGRKRQASSASSLEESFICREAKLCPPPQRRTKAQRPSPLFSDHLSDFQYSLLTCPPDILLRDFIPRSWDQRFDATQVQFINEGRDRDWFKKFNALCDKDVSKVIYHYTDESSDDSDAFDNGENLDPQESELGQNPSHSDPWSDEENASASQQQHDKEAREDYQHDETSRINALNNAQEEIEKQQQRHEGWVSGAGLTIGIDDLKARAESSYISGRIAPGMLEKQCSYLRKVAAKPEYEEALTGLFIDKGGSGADLEGDDAQGSFKEAELHNMANHAPHSIAYMVEQKTNSIQVSARMTHIVKKLEQQSNSQLRPKGLCYCLSNDYCRRMAEHFENSGIAAEVLSVEDAEDSSIEETLERFRSTDLQVLCLTQGFNSGTNLPPVDFVFHISIPASLKLYAEETLLCANGKPPSVCVLFYRPRDRVETERSLGLVAKRKHRGKSGEDTGTLLRGAARERAEKDLDEVASFCSDGYMCRLSSLITYAGAKQNDYSCKHATCCDNCRVRLGLEGSIFPLKDENKTITLGSTATIQDVKLCQVDITSFIHEVLKGIRSTETCSDWAYNNMRILFCSCLNDFDSPLDVEKIVEGEWSSISPIQCLLLNSIRSRLVFIFIEQGIMSYVDKRARNKKMVIARDHFDSFIAEMDRGNVKFYLRNVRLFASFVTDDQSSSITVAGLRGNSLTDRTHSICSGRDTNLPSGRKSQHLPNALSRTNSDRLDNERPTCEQQDTSAVLNGQSRTTNSRICNEESPCEPQHTAAVLSGDFLTELKVASDGVMAPKLKSPLRSLSWLSLVPFLAQYELWRLFNEKALTEAQIEDDIKAYFHNSQTYDCHDACTFIHELAGTKDTMRDYEKVAAAASRSGLSVDTGSGAVLIFSSTYSKHLVETLTLLPPKKAHDCRMFRKFGSHRFLFVTFSDAFTKVQVRRLIDRPKHIIVAGRKYRYLWTDIRKSPKQIVLFAESGVGIKQNMQMTVADVMEWCLPKELNRDLTVARELMCLGSYFSESTQSGILPTGCLEVAEGFVAPKAGMKSSGGCGLISRDALNSVWTDYCSSSRKEGKCSDYLKGWDIDDDDDDPGCPYSSFEGMIGGMCGAWILDPGLGRGIKVLCRSTQSQFNVPMKSLISSEETICTVEYDSLYDTVEVESWDTGLKGGSLNLRFIQLLEHRGVNVEFLKKYAGAGTDEILLKFQSIDESNLRALVAGKKAEKMRDMGSYPVKRCKHLRLVPDHHGLLKEDEAFLASRLDKERRQIEKSEHVIVTSSSPFFPSDIVKFKLVNKKTLQDRAEQDAANSSPQRKNAYDYFESLQSGIVVHTKGNIGLLASAFGGDFFDSLCVCWDDELVSQVKDNDDANDILDERHEPTLYEKSLLSSHDATAVDRVNYIMRLLVQCNQVKTTEAQLITWNDKKGVDSAEGKKVATRMYVLTHHPFWIYKDNERFLCAFKKIPHWQQSSSGNSSCGVYKSEKVLGQLWDYMKDKIHSLNFEEGESAALL